MDEIKKLDHLHDQLGKVVFRVFKDCGDVIALFPYSQWDDNSIVSYQHIGQHGGADYKHCIRITRPATKAEYGSLERELKNMGYKLTIMKRV